jgi:hypothetical protein
MNALIGVILGFAIAVIAGRKAYRRNYIMYGFLILIALLTALYMIVYMFTVEKPIP